MQYAVDIAILCILALFTFVGVRRGFIRSAIHFVGGIFAAVISAALGGSIARWAFTAFFRDAMVAKLQESISTMGNDSIGKAAREFFENLPEFLVRALESAGISQGALEGAVASKAGEAAELMTDSLAPVFVNFLKVLIVLVLFLLLMMVVRALADVLGRVFQLPLLRELNGALGGLFGFLLALIPIWLVVSAIQVFLPMLTEEAQYDVQLLLNRSLITGLIVKLNPLSWMFR